MHIKVDTGRAAAASADLLRLSRTLRGLRARTEELRRRLRRQSELDGCRSQLQRQEESLSLLTARLVNLSLAMEEIAGAYAAAEERGRDRLEEEGGPHRAAAAGTLRVAGGEYRESINRLLGR